MEVKCGVVRQACASALCVSCVPLCFIFVRQLSVQALSLFFISCASMLCFNFIIRGCVSCVFVLRFGSCFVRRALCSSFSFQFPALSCLSLEPQLRSAAWCLSLVRQRRASASCLSLLREPCASALCLNKFNQ